MLSKRYDRYTIIGTTSGGSRLAYDIMHNCVKLDFVLGNNLQQIASAPMCHVSMKLQ